MSKPLTTGAVAWQSVMAAHDAAAAAGNSFHEQHIKPIRDAEDALFGEAALLPSDPRYVEMKAWHAEKGILTLEEQHERLTDIEAEAHTALLYMPAPHLAALRWKLEQTLDGSRITQWCDEIHEVIAADYRRLLPLETPSGSLDWRAVAAEHRASRDAVTGPGEHPQPLWDRHGTTVKAVSAFPVSSVQELAEKMDILVEEFSIGDFGGGDEAQHIYADILRLAGGAEGSAPANSDAAIISAWQKRLAAFEEMQRRPVVKPAAGQNYTPEEQAFWDVIDAAEIAIQGQAARTPQGVAIQLWSALTHIADDGQDELPIYRGDLAHFEQRDGALDWNARLIVAALRSLHAMEAGA